MTDIHKAGYKLVPIQKLVELKASIHGDCFRGTDWELETISTMLIAASHEAPQPIKREPLTDEEICAALGIDGSDDWTFTVAYAIIAAYERKNGIGEQP